jgi:stress response protein YsnF
VLGEEVDVQKRARVIEEVEISKESVQKTKQVGGKVRKEQVRVEDRTDAEVTDATTGAGTTLEGDYAGDGSHGTI